MGYFRYAWIPEVLFEQFLIRNAGNELNKADNEA